MGSKAKESFLMHESFHLNNEKFILPNMGSKAKESFLMHESFHLNNEK
jgi:hypothetical protein